MLFNAKWAIGYSGSDDDGYSGSDDDGYSRSDDDGVLFVLDNHA